MIKKKYNCALFVLSSLFTTTLQPQVANAVTLYNGSGLPELQNFLAPGAIDSEGNILTNTTITPVTGGVEVQTDNIDTTAGATPTSGYLGYTNYVALPPSFSTLQLVNNSFPELNANDGYSIFFDVAINPLTESDPNRASFSLLAISSDVTKGIELDFESNLIFAQSDTIDGTGFSEFVRSETSSAIATTTTNSYELRVKNNSYDLFANSSPTAILTGNLRDYEYNINATDPNLPFNPYETPNFLFFGDLTDQAGGTFTLGSVRLETATTTPESNVTLALALLGMGFIGKHITNNKK